MLISMVYSQMKLYPNVTILFSIWFLSLLLISYIGFSTLPHSGKFTGDFFGSLSNWDGGHFLGIAEYGYREKFQYAFFPLYPLVIRGFSQLTKDYLLAGVFVSALSGFLGMQLLYKLVAADFEKKIAGKVILALLFFPTSFFFLTVYSEGLFFFLVIASFLFLKKRNLFWATIFASLASATRLAGLALVLALLVDVYVTEGISRKNAFVLLAPAGFLIYCWYLYTQTGDPLYFISAEAHWQRSVSLPGLNFLAGIKNSNFLELLFAIFGVGLVFRSFRFLPVSYSIYGLVSLLLPLFTPSLTSIPRFLLPIFPVFILIALSKNQYVLLANQIISLMLLSLFAVFFVNGYWVS